MDWWETLRENLWAVWLSVAMLLGAAEMFSLDLVLLMLAVGAIGGMGADLLGAPFLVQVLVALGSSVAMLGLVRPNMRARLQSGPTLRHGPDLLLGEHGVATQTLSAHEGLIKIAGETWTARPYDENVSIDVGATVQVLEVRGATAYVVEVPQLS